MISADTNLFVYASDRRDPGKYAVASTIVDALGSVDAAIGLQVIGELQNALRRRVRIAPHVAYYAARDLLSRFATFAYDERAVELALGEASLGRLSYWDALLLAAADAAGVTAMISEDMRDGLVFGGLEVVNPFSRDSGPSDRVRQLLAL
ncbi:MAG TPA: PIN domain-containing protein [Caulobacteraceae bacterium]|nr:PIN domain-containing protein [Caulobacteraceae bacterium]